MKEKRKEKGGNRRAERTGCKGEQQKQKCKKTGNHKRKMQEKARKMSQMRKQRSIQGRL